MYVDGVRVDIGGGFAGGVGAGGGGSPSRLDDINPDAIERIEILKGAAAATLYGTEASGGVIQIFTKKGSAGAPRWSFQVEQGFSNYPEDRYKPNSGFARTPEQAALLSDFAGRTVQPYEVVEAPIIRDIFETGYFQTYSGSVSGGNDQVTYFLSGRFQDDNGPLGLEDLGPVADVADRKQGTLTVSFFPTDKLQFRATSAYSESHLEVPNTNNNIYGVSSLAMFGKPEMAFCNEGSIPAAGFRCVDADNPSLVGAGNPTGQAAFSTLREAMQVPVEDDARHFNGSLNANYALLPNVNLDATFGVDFTSQRSTEFARFNYNVDQFTGNRTAGFRDLAERDHRNITADVKGNWTTNFGPSFSSAFVLGAQYFDEQTKTSGGFGADFPGPGLEVLEAASNLISFEEFIRTETQAGIFVQEQLGWRDFAFFTVGGRYDAHSAFGENFEGVFYPKVAISVVPSDIPGWGQPLGLSTFRVRGAVGQSGKQPGAFDKFTTFSPLATAVGPGLQPLNLGNQNLEPEVSTEWEGGAEAGFLDDRLVLDVTYWDRVVEDALVARQFAVSGGFIDEQLDNIGRLEASGWELSATAFPVNTPNFGLEVFANAAYISETVTDLGGAPPLKVGGSYPRYRNFIIEGFAPGALFGEKLLDVGAGQVPFDTNGDRNPDTMAEFEAFLSTAPDGGLNSSALNPLRAPHPEGLPGHYLGKPTPDWSGSFGINIDFLRNFRFANLFEYKAGNFTITNLTDAFRQSNPVIGRNIPLAAEVESTILNPASTAQERVQAALIWANELKALSPYSGMNTMENGDFLRWREASLTYTVPAGAMGRIGVGLDNIAVTLAGRNLALFTDYSGIDPETNVFGRGGSGGQIDQNFGQFIDAFGFPLQRRYSLAVRVGF